MFIYDIESKYIRRLTLSSPDNDLGIGYYTRWGLAWAHDGKSLIAEGHDKGLFQIDADTGQTTFLTDSSGQRIQGGSPSFSPDGSQIAYSGGGTSQFPNINIYSFDTREVTTMPGGIYPHWSTINKLVYLRDGIYIRDVVSQEERKVPISPYTSIQRAKWSPDGTKLVYSAYRDDNWDIYVHDLGSGRDTRLTGGFADQMPGWSPTGEQIVWTCSTFEPPAGQQLYVMNADGTEKRRLFSENYDGSYGATWSPDGKKIAFIAPTGVDNSDILVFDFQKGLRNVTKHLKGRQGNPSWSPDSTSLAFSGSVEGQFENWDIYVLNLDSGAAKTVVASPTETEWCPAWSPLGNEVAYSIQDTRTRMLRNLVLVLSTGMSRVLPEPAENEISCGTWSPDGRYLAFQGYGKQEGQIVLLDMSRGVFEIVAHSARRPTWAADPDKLYFVTSNGDVVRMSLADRTISLQARTGDLDVNLRSFAVSPDGRYIVIVENLLPGVGTMRWGLFIHDTVSGTRRELVPGLSMYLINDVVWAR